ncbi:MAG: hypothetical protein KDD40_12850, partial [Bdellovibrionales bacterium]|nr:hypothetical protein [Bdellovibrionales bacterium]
QVQQEYMQRQQVIGRLTQELYKIQMQIQQISTGSYGGSTITYPYTGVPGGGGYVPGGSGSGTATTPNTGSPIRRR